MTLNFTLVGQALTFAFFTWFTLHYIWPPLRGAIAKREQTIAEGLAAGEAGKQQLLEAQSQAEVLIQAARSKADEIVGAARSQAQEVVEAAKREAHHESQQRLKMADAQIQHKWEVLKAQLAQALGELVIISTEKTLMTLGASNKAQFRWLRQVIDTLS